MPNRIPIELSGHHLELKRLRRRAFEAKQHSEAAMHKVLETSKAIADRLEQRTAGFQDGGIERLLAESSAANRLFGQACHKWKVLLDEVDAQRALILGDWKSDEGSAGPITLVRHEDPKLVVTEADGTGHQDMVPR